MFCKFGNFVDDLICDLLYSERSFENSIDSHFKTLEYKKYYNFDEDFIVNHVLGTKFLFKNSLISHSFFY